MPLPAIPTPNPDCFTFRSDDDDEFMPGDYAVDVPTRKHAAVHPLAGMLFDQYERELRSVFLAKQYVTVTKWGDVQWTQQLELSVGHLIAQYLMLNEPIPPKSDFRAVDADVAILPDDSEVVQCIKELLKSEIKPMVQRDGGDIRFLSFDDATGVVSLEMMGACKTCPSSRNTLKDGIERMLSHFIEEVKEVVEIKNPEAELMERERAEAAYNASADATSTQSHMGVVGGSEFLPDGNEVPTPDQAKTPEEREAAIKYQEYLDAVARDDKRVAEVQRRQKMRSRLMETPPAASRPSSASMTDDDAGAAAAAARRKKRSLALMSFDELSEPDA